MLSKILGIRNVGRIDSKAAVELHRLTIIYGDNGRGKTTFSAIVRSLATGEAGHILERRTLLTNDAPMVTMKAESFKVPLVFKDGTWSQTLPNVEIFDARFISENVYEGNSVEYDHKRQLHHFVMGAEGVALAQAVDAHDATIRTINSAIQTAEDGIRARFADARGGAMDLRRFLGLPHNPAVAAAIEAQKQHVDAARTVGKLTSKSGLTVPILPTVDLIKLKALLDLEVSGVAASAEEMTRLHAERCMGANSKDWLAAGVQHLDARAAARGAGQPGCEVDGHRDAASDLCPFCGADVSANILIAAYRSFFSNSYRELSDKIAAQKADIGSRFGDGPRVTLRHTIEQNALLAEWWRQYGVTFDAGLDVDSILAAHHEVGSRLRSRLDAKRAAPLERSGLDADDEAALLAYERALTELESYAAAVAVANADIIRVRNAAGSSNLDDEERRYWELVCQQRRHQPDVVKECERHAELLAQKQQVEAEKQAARTALDLYAKAVFAEYQASINQHLQNCGCGYNIGGTKVNYMSGKPSTEYHLTITGKPIPLAPSKKDPLSPSFRNTLSEGDKSTLAFAFFLSRIEMDSKIADKIIVFDDPITSQDNHRRAWTRRQILEIAGRCKQVVVLTHDTLFARQLWDDARIPCHTLHLDRDGDRSVLSDWNIERATEIDYFRHHRTLTDYLSGGAKGSDLRVIAQSIRPLLEGNLRMRFPEHFGHGEWLGGFLKKVREATDDHPLFPMQAQLVDLDDICSFSNRYHHDQNPGAAAEPVVDGEVSAYARRALAVARGIGTVTIA